ncbi:MAG: ATP-binding protein [bacterium]
MGDVFLIGEVGAEVPFAFHVPMRLRWKFLIGILDLVLLFGSIHIFFVKIYLGRSLEEELRFRLKTLASSLAAAAVPLVLLDEKVELHKLMMKSRAEEHRIRYILVLDRAGSPVSHLLDRDGVPADLLAANSLDPNLGERYARIEDARHLHKTFLDIAYPLGEMGRYGTLRVGMDEGGIRYTLNRMTMAFLFMILLFVILAGLGAVAVARWINRPIQQIQSALHAFELSSPLPHLEVRTGDELEEFAGSVQAMMCRLKNTHEQMDLLRTKMFRAERVAVLGTLAAGIAHEIRNPLAGMMNCLKRLSKDPGEPKVRSYLPLMESAARHIDETVSRFMHFARAPAKRGEDFCVNRAVETALSLIRHRLEGKAIRVDFEPGADLPLLEGDKTLLEQILLNLLINAMDAIQNSGTISIRTRLEDGHVVVEVRDTGIGIAQEDLKHIFDPFFTKQKEEGTGLGLAISHEIIQQFQGSIRVESEPGAGTLFRVEIPAKSGC